MMGRVNVYAYDDAGGKRLEGWFDPDTAERLQENTRWNGNNAVSVHCADEFTRQVLIRTKGGRWVRHTSSRWQGSEPIYEFLDDESAREWLLCDDSAEANEWIRQYLGSVEEERGPGRPSIGERVEVRLPPALLAKLDRAAQVAGVNRAEMTRRLVDAGLTNEVDAEALRYLRMPAPKGFVCPVCKHDASVHRIAGCDVDPCDCPAPFGRVVAGDPAPAQS